MTRTSADQAMQDIQTLAGQAVPAFPGIMPDHWIRERAVDHGMIEPFTEKLQRDGVISYGLSSYGYDARCSEEFMIFTNVDNALVDPKNFFILCRIIS